jgi:aminotransferase
VAEWRRNVVVVGTFSKSFALKGWRVGFVLADHAICEQATKIQDAMIICAPMISQMVGGARPRRLGLCAVSSRVRPLPSARRRLDCGDAARVGSLAGAGFFAFARVDGCRDSTALASRLLEEAHVVTIPGAAFGRSGEGCLRLSFGSASNEDLIEGLDRLGRFF